MFFEFESNTQLEEATAGLAILGVGVLIALVLSTLLASCFVETDDGVKQITLGQPQQCENMRTVVLDGSRVGTRSRQDTSAMATVVQQPTCSQVGIVIRENK